MKTCRLLFQWRMQNEIGLCLSHFYKYNVWFGLQLCFVQYTHLVAIDQKSLWTLSFFLSISLQVSNVVPNPINDFPTIKSLILTLDYLSIIISISYSLYPTSIFNKKKWNFVNKWFHDFYILCYVFMKTHMPIKCDIIVQGKSASA